MWFVSKGNVVYHQQGGGLMKLAEALVLRADVQKRVAQLRTRLQQSALIQEGEQPPENPQELLNELDQLLSQLVDLIKRINRTNMQTVFSEGSSLADAIAQRDNLSLRYSVINDVAATASDRIDRYGRSEIRKVSTVDVPALRRQLDETARQRRELDTAIQSANWSTDVLE